MTKKKATKFAKILVAITVMVASIFGINTLINAEEAPSHHKSIHDNNDGTYTLSLDVIGANEKKVNKANVVVIFDVSGSMTENTGNSEITYTETNQNGDNLYGKVDGNYVRIYRHTSGWGWGATTYYTLGQNSNSTRYTGQRYLRQAANQTRLEAAQEAVNGLANSLLSKNTSENPNTIQMALVSFSNKATVSQAPTTSYTTFESAVNKLKAEGGTNWEDALSTAASVNFNDTDPTYVIFVSDGNPTFRNTEGTYANHNNDYDRDYHNAYGVWGSGSENTTTVTRCYEHAKDDAKTIVDSGKTFYTIGVYGNVDRMQSLTTDSGASSDNYYSADNTAALQEALNSILEKIERSGVGDVTISDGTTQKVSTSTGNVDLLHVDESSYKYKITFPIEENGKVLINETEATITTEGGVSTLSWTEKETSKSITGKVEGNNFVYEWTEANDLYNFKAPEAKLEDGAVNWDLSQLEVLLNNVTYTVLFDVWPSQTTYDLISDIDNGITTYDSQDENIKKYLIKNDDGSFSLKTNTDATLTYSDSRYGVKDKTIDYNTLNPVATGVSNIKIKKSWVNDLDGDKRKETSAKLYITKDKADYGKIDANKEVEPFVVSEPTWEKEVFISTGLISLVKDENDNITSAIIREKGHDYSFREDASAYNWELDVETYRPMMIDKDLVNLVLVKENIPEVDDTNVIVENNKVKYVKIDGKVYEVSTNTSGTISATNIRRSNLNIAKKVTGDEKVTPKDALFEFTITVNDANKEELWFSVAPIDDPENPITDDGIVTGNGVVKENSGYYHVASGTEIKVYLKANWNVRFTNLPQGTTYTIEESSMPQNFAFISNEIEESNNVTDATTTYTSKTNKITSATIDKKNISYQVTYNDEYTITEVKGEKTWTDANNQDGKRPESITINLLADGELVEAREVKADANGKWNWSFTELPYKKDGKVIKYTITENAVEGYKSEVNGYNVTNTHIPEKTEATVKKVWNDANNQDGIRPDSLTVTLSNGDTVTLNEGNNWTQTIKDLPKYKSGTEIEYSWTEGELPEGYELTSNTTEGTVTTLTNTHTPATTEATVKKVWADGENQDGIRPASLTVTLSNGDTVTLNEGNSWTQTIKDLPKYKSGTEIEYSWTEGELPEGYKLTDTKTEGTVTTLTNTHTPATTEATVKKVWADGENQDGIRPASLTVTLSNGDTVTLNEGNSWTQTIKDLPKYNKGTEIEYSWTEGELPEGYKLTDTKAEGTVTTLTNTHTPATTEATVKKVWADGENQDGIRPASLTVTLSNGDIVTLNEGNGWTAKVENLPKFNKGTEIKYSWTEGELPEGYKLTDTKIEGTVTTLTNTHTPATTEATVKKVWNDANNQDGKRPASLTVTLSNGDTVTLNEGNNWTQTIKDLPKYKNGTEIEYSWTEGELPEGYELTGNTTEGTVTTLTNTHATEVTEATIKKVWADADDQDGIRPASLTVTLSNGDTVTLNKGNNWTQTIKDLPRYSNGKEIKYTWTEGKLPEGYKLTDTKTEGTITTLTNTHTPVTTEATIKKVWNDADNQDGIRPDSLTVTLSNGTTVTLNEGNGWTAKVENLPKFDKGVEIKYSWTEGELPEGYKLTGNTTEGTVTTLTNTHTPAEVEVTVTKAWIDNNNSEGKRPTSVTLTLNANGKKVQDVVLSNSNNWEETIKELPKFENGELITYSVEEKNVDANYEVSYSNNKLTAINTIKELNRDIPVTKVWDDSNDQDGVRSKKIKVNLIGTIDKEEVHKDTIELTIENVSETDPNKWLGVFKDVPTFKDGKLISYSISEEELNETEEESKYQTTITGDTSGYTITNKHIPDTTSVLGKKVWEDASDQDGKRPTSITVKLYADEAAEPVKTTEVTADEKGNWNFEFTDLPKYRDHGTEINYTVKEEVDEKTAEYYESKVESYTITNTHTPETITYNLTKNWEDFDNQDGVRPDSITVTITGKTSSATVYTKTVTVTEGEDGKWTYNFTDLPKYNNKELVQYTITEEAVESYTTGTIKDVITEEATTELFNEITNTHTPETTSISGQKTWEDDTEEVRPSEIKVKLFADGEYVFTFIVTKEDNWKYLIEDIDKYKDGKEIKYTIEEELIDGYIATYNGFDITNTYIYGKGGDEPPVEVMPPKTGVNDEKDKSVVFLILSIIFAILGFSKKEENI